MESVELRKCATNAFTFQLDKSEYINDASLVKSLKATVQRLKIESELKQEAIDTASSLVRELQSQNSGLKEKHSKVVKENEQLLHLLDALMKKVNQPKPPVVMKRGISTHHQTTDTNTSHQRNSMKRILEKEKLKNKFKGFLNVSVNSSSQQTFNQSCQSLSQNELMEHSSNNQNDPETSNRSNMTYSKVSHNQQRTKYSQDTYEIESLRRRLDKTEKQMSEFILAGQLKQDRYLKTIESLSMKFKKQ